MQHGGGAPARNPSGATGFGVKPRPDPAPWARTAPRPLTRSDEMAAPVLGGDRAITVAEGGTVAVATADLTATDADSTVPCAAPVTV